MTRTPPSSITPGPEQLKALTHPVRVRMLGLLRIEGPATATSLATRLGLNTGATSYHLRQLAQHGFIVDDKERGNGRERWWRAAHSSTTTAPPPPGDDAGQETLDAYLQSVVTVYAEQLRRAMEELPLLPQPWRDAATFSDWTLRLTATRAKAVVEALSESLRTVEEDDGDDAEAFVVQFNAYPFPGHLGGDPS